MREEEREAEKKRNANKKRVMVAVVCLGFIAVKEEKVSLTKRKFGRHKVFSFQKKYWCKKAVFILVFKRHFLIWLCVSNKSS